MATSVQTLPLSRGTNKKFRNPFSGAPPLASRCGMGSVGSLVERPDVSPTKANRAVPQVRPKQANGLLKKGFTQRELLNYLNIARWAAVGGRGGRGVGLEARLTLPRPPNRKEPKMNPNGDNEGSSGVGARKEDNLYAKIYNRDGAEVDLTKNSLPSGGKYEKVMSGGGGVRGLLPRDPSLILPRPPVSWSFQAGFRSSAFKPVAPKNFSSMQNLYPASASDEADHGPHWAKAVSTSSSSSSPSRQGGAASGGNKVAEHPGRGGKGEGAGGKGGLLTRARRPGAGRRFGPRSEPGGRQPVRFGPQLHEQPAAVPAAFPSTRGSHQVTPGFIRQTKPLAKG